MVNGLVNLILQYDNIFTNKKVNPLVDKTKLNKQTPKSESLRTTIPSSIIKQFGLTEYDELEWSMVVENNELVVKVKPIKTGRTE